MKTTLNCIYWIRSKRPQWNHNYIHFWNCVWNSVDMDNSPVLTVSSDRWQIAESLGWRAAVLSISLWVLRSLTFDLWLAWRNCLTSTDKWRLTGVREEQSSSVSEKCACNDTKQKNQWLLQGFCRGWKSETETYQIRHEVHSLIRSQTGKSCGAHRCLYTLIDWSVLIVAWTGGCCCCNGLCQGCRAAHPGMVHICWWLIWERMKPTWADFTLRI